MQWKDDDLACRTVAERLAKYEKHIKDRIPRFAAYSERVRLLVDTDRNGSVFALWTSLPAEPEITARLAQTFRAATVEEVLFDNPLLDHPEVNALYFGSA
ncbi:MAG: hypothetical protein FJ148_27220 [Deltaproteobacteria bacterium]|nr:hypothetical protein [Deltaproteobacteria bacterium]